MARTAQVMVQKVIGIYLAQSAHVAHVLFTAERVDHGAGAEEEQRLEEGVRHQVEDAGGKRAAPQARNM